MIIVMRRNCHFQTFDIRISVAVHPYLSFIHHIMIYLCLPSCPNEMVSGIAPLSLLYQVISSISSRLPEFHLNIYVYSIYLVYHTQIHPPRIPVTNEGFFQDSRTSKWFMILVVTGILGGGDRSNLYMFKFLMILTSWWLNQPIW